MNRKVYTLFVCALLSNSFGDEYSAGTIPSTLSTPKSESSSLSTDQLENTSLPPSCQMVCSNAPTALDGDYLIHAANAEAQLIGIANTRTNVQLFLDVKAGLFGLRNGNTLYGVIINPKTKEGVVTIPQSEPLGRVPFRQLLAFLKDGLEPGFKSDKLERFEVGSESPDILKVENDILVHLIGGIEDELKTNPRVGIQVAIIIANKIIHFQRTSLSEVVKNLLDIEGIIYKGDMVKAYNVEIALDSFFRKIPGGIPGLIEKGVQFDLKQIGVAPNGLLILEGFVRNIGKVEDLGKDLGHLLNDRGSFLNFIVNLGGELNTGVTGLLKVVSKIDKFLNKDATLEEVINVIMQVVTANKDRETDLSTQLKQDLSGLIEAVEGAGFSDSLSGLLNILKALRRGSLKIERVNISEIISLLITARYNSNNLETVVSILRELRKVVGIEEALPRLLLVSILNVNNPMGLELLRGVGIKIDLEVKAVNGSIIRHILESEPDVASRLSQDVYDALSNLPIIDKVIESVEKTIAVFDVKDDLKDLLKANEIVYNLIKAVFQVIGGLELQIPDDTVSELQQTENRCSSLNFYLSLDEEDTIIAYLNQYIAKQ